MRIEKILLKNFRNYERKEVEFGIKTLILGKNGAGKTNILEALYMLATGKSFRADTDQQLIRYDQQVTILKSQILPAGRQVTSNSQITGLQITIADSKRYEVNGVPRRMVDFAGQLKAVMFGPADMELVTGSPSVRRRYLDFVITQNDREYRRCLVSYEKGLRQRNKLLDFIKEGKANRPQLYFWDKLMIKNGEYITRKREEFLGSFNTPSGSPPDSGGENKGGYRIVYDKSVISEARLKQYEEEEVAAGSTLVGPHRDDFVINFNNRDVSKFGSRGEQRMGVLAMKVWERDYLTLEELPVLLLDDIYSELDHRHRETVIALVDDHIDKGGQVIMTTADEHLVPKDKSWNIIRLNS